MAVFTKRIKGLMKLAAVMDIFYIYQRICASCFEPSSSNMVMLASVYHIFAEVCHKLITLFIQAIKDNR